MADTGTGGPTQAEIEQWIANAISLMPTTFVAGGAYMPVATLLASYPADVTQLGKYAKVNDLWGSVRTVMVCEYDGSSYYWRPQRTDYAMTNAATVGTINLVPLVTAPQTIFPNNLTGNMTLSLSNTNAWPGAEFEVKFSGLLGLFGLSLTGLVGGGTLSILTGGSRFVRYTSTGWREFT